MEVADDGRVNADFRQTLNNVRHALGGAIVVHRDTDELRTGAGERNTLLDRRVDIGSVGVSHRLDNDRRVAADTHVSDADSRRFTAENRRHGLYLF
jgi:hypothetical protein